MGDNEDDGLRRIVLKLTKEDPELRINKLDTIHPIYEAVIALLRQQLTDPEIESCFAKCDGKDGLKSVLLVDAILEEYKKTPSYSTNLKQLLFSGKSIGEITQMAALQISENRRLCEGKIIQRLGSSDNKYLLKAMKCLSPSEVYVKASDINVLKEKSRKMKKNRTAGVLILALGLATLYGLTYYKLDKRAKDSENKLIDLLIENPSLYTNSTNLDSMYKY